jgi:hypothetical protein
MTESNKLTEWQYRLIFTLMFLIIWAFAFGVLRLIAEKYHSNYAFFASIICLVDVLILPLLKKKKMSEDEKNTYPLFLTIGLVLILWPSILLYTNRQPGIWIWSFVYASSFLTSAIIFQHLRNHIIIP